MDIELTKKLAKFNEGCVKEVLDNLWNIMVNNDSVDEETGTTPSFFMEFDEQDMFHATSIMFSVCSNYAIKHKLLTKENAKDKISKFRELVKEVFGLDTITEAQIAVMCHQTPKAEA